MMHEDRMNFGDECNCGNCDNNECPFGVEAKYLVGIIPNIIQKVGCLSHPKAREVLMRDVVVELDKLASMYEMDASIVTDTITDQAMACVAGASYRKAISLIRDGVKKE